MATAAKKTTGGTAKTTATRTPSKRATTKRATTTRATTTRSTARTTTTSAAPRARKTASRGPARAASPSAVREPAQLLGTAGLAAAGLAGDAVGLARRLPERLESVRSIDALERLVEAKAEDGRRLLDGLAKDDRVSRVLARSANTRSQVKAALTSVGRVGTVAAAAADGQAKVARSQVAGARTSVSKATSRVKGAVTSIRRTGDAAIEAAIEQSKVARGQVKGAATSTRRTAATVVDAATS